MRRFILSFCILLFLISSCSSKPSDTFIQTAISQTELARVSNTPFYTSTPIQTSTTLPTATITPTSTPIREYYLGDAEYKYGYVLTALSIQDPVEVPYYINNDKSQKYIRIEVTISNVSGDPLKIGTANSFSLIDKEGFSYAPKSDPFIKEPDIFYVSLDHGERLHLFLYFEIPFSAKITNLNAQTDFGNGGNVLSTSLLPAPNGYTPTPELISQFSTIDLAPKGTPANKFGYSLIVLDFNDSATVNNPWGQIKGNKYVGVQVSLENISSNNNLEVRSSNAFLIDHQGFIYPSILVNNNSLDTTNLTKGEKTKGWVFFSIPEDSNLYCIKYLTQTFTNDFLYSAIK
ncbi:MAG: DUF4352 domain-containing protein [Anaerolineaceae bacterium]